MAIGGSILGSDSKLILEHTHEKSFLIHVVLVGGLDIVLLDLLAN